MSETPLMVALDTSHMKGSIAVTRGEEVLCEIVFDASDTHSATLMPAVDVCLSTAGVCLDDADLFGVVVGPGSFTGLRIGLATIKAFAAVKRRPVIAVPSLELLAAAIPCARYPVMPLIDARRGEVYAALYDTGAGLPAEVLPPHSVKPGNIRDVFERSGCGSSVVLCGTGAIRYRNIIEPVVPAGSIFAPERWALPYASIIAALAQGHEPLAYEDVAVLEPLYIRSPDARLPAGTKLGEGGGS